MVLDLAQLFGSGPLAEGQVEGLAGVLDGLVDQPFANWAQASVSRTQKASGPAISSARSAERRASAGLPSGGTIAGSLWSRARSFHAIGLAG